MSRSVRKGSDWDGHLKMVGVMCATLTASGGPNLWSNYGHQCARVRNRPIHQNTWALSAPSMDPTQHTTRPFCYWSVHQNSSQCETIFAIIFNNFDFEHSNLGCAICSIHTAHWWWIKDDQCAKRWFQVGFYFNSTMIRICKSGQPPRVGLLSFFFFLL